MKLSDNTILITGGNAGIGLAFAERFIDAGNTVVVCGRREEALQQAKEKYPSLITYVSDLSVEAERVKLFEWVTAHYPEMNVLVNNAGIQQRFNVLKADAKNDWSYFNKEITINMEAAIQMSMLFAPYFSEKENAAIINVTSGLAFTPMVIAPIYSATKGSHAFIHCQLKTSAFRHFYRSN